MQCCNEAALESHQDKLADVYESVGLSNPNGVVSSAWRDERLSGGSDDYVLGMRQGEP
jgi:hypothetical protein